MRVFWALVVVLVIVAIGIPVVSARAARQKEEAQRAQAVAARDQAAMAAELARKAEDSARRAAEEASKAKAADQAPAVTTPQVPVSEPPPPAPSASEAIKTAETPAKSESEEAPPPAPTSVAPVIPEVKPPAEPSPSTKNPTADPKPEAPAAVTPAAEIPAGPKIVTREDGSMLVDDRFVVKGKGTVEAPYEVTWELLVSASETYDPRQGRKKLPGRITMLDGKIVRLTGNVAYPMFVEQPRELLSMLNQWDGCCIGVPPTPYDAVEVHMRDVVDKEQRLATYGVVEGKLEVKPYLAGDWLVGLYVMENATLTVKEYGGFGS